MGVDIKSHNNGFKIIVDKSISFVDAREKIIEKFEGSKEFFHGAKFLDIEAPGLKSIDVDYLKKLLVESYGVVFNTDKEIKGDVSVSIENSTINTKQEKESLSSDKTIHQKLASFDESIGKIKQTIKKIDIENIINNETNNCKDLKTKFIFENMRSGSEIDYDGNVIVFGDVNPGSKIVASGSIIIMGSFRGIAHAGRKNTEPCFIAALKLLPLQIRIHDVFAIPPQDAKLINNAMVIVENGEIVIKEF